VLRVRLNILLTCCVSGVHSHEDIMLRMCDGDQVANTAIIIQNYNEGARYTSTVMRATIRNSHN